MKNWLLLLLLFPTLLIAQVGVNTTTPNAALDIQSTNNGVLIPRVQLTDALDIVTVVNPAGGVLAKSTLVYNFNTSGVAPDNVTDGFYYWNGVRWMPISGTPNWSLNGNTGISQPANPVTYGTSTIASMENFVGTKDNNDVVIGTNNIERFRVKNTTGNIGIGTAIPNGKFHVIEISDSEKNTILGEARQINSGFDYNNIAIKGFGSGVPSWGFGVGVMGIGNKDDSYYATGIYAHLGSTQPSAPYTNQALLANGNNIGNAAILTNGNVGIGIPINTNPTNQLHINSATNGAVRIVDGTEGDKKVLTSNATGVATWQPIGIDNIQANLAAVTGITISYTNTVNYLQTGASITLPPGRYAVNVTMLLSTVPGAYTNSNEAFWVRSTFSDSNGVNPIFSPDIVGSALVSGNLIPSTLYSLITGMVVINNTTAANKTYYYVAGRVVTNNSTRSIAFFGGNYWAENNIIAYRLN